MRFSAQEEYGLRCLLTMARRENEGAITIPEIAKQEGLSIAYVGKLMRILREGGLVDSTRGQKGGYLLAKPSDQINLFAVLTVLGGDMFPKDHCNRHAGTEVACVHMTDCSIRSAWAGLDVFISRILRGIMLRDLVRTEGSMDEWIRGLEVVRPGTPRLNIIGQS
jgi:Rrf2 family protein